MGGHCLPVIAECNKIARFRLKCDSYHPLQTNRIGRHRRPFLPEDRYLLDISIIRQAGALRGVSTNCGDRGLRAARPECRVTKH